MEPELIVELLKKLAVLPSQMLLTLKDTDGIGLTVTVLVIEETQPLSEVTVNTTVYVPAEVYKCVGLAEVDVVLSPKLQACVSVPLEIVEVFVKAVVVP